MPELIDSNNFVNFEISSLHLDSRNVKAGSVFFAIKGTHLNGIDFIEEARSKGAKLIVSDEESKSEIKKCRCLDSLGKMTNCFVWTRHVALFGHDTSSCLERTHCPVWKGHCRV